MRILYVGIKYDYGKKEQGYSFEHYNLYKSLASMNNSEHEVIYFAIDEVMREVGRDKMNERLLKVVEKEKPDVGWFAIFQDEIKKETLAKVTKQIPTFNWFTDDHWRFDNFGRHYAQYFTYIGTTDSQAPAKYHKIGYQNVIKTQWACNHNDYKPTGIDTNKIGKREDKDFQYNITFIGQPHGDRREVIKKIRKAGLRVNCWGSGWPDGRASQEKMLEIFSTSKINLNLTKSSDLFSIKAIAKIFLKRRPNGSFRPYLPSQWLDNYKSLVNKKRGQIKGRNFEIPGTGGFFLTGDADNLNDYYEDGKEIAIFKDTDDLIEKAKYYIEHLGEREAIAKAGYDRTLQEHTYEKRFNEIFKEMGLIK